MNNIDPILALAEALMFFSKTFENLRNDYDDDAFISQWSVTGTTVLLIITAFSDWDVFSITGEF